MLPLWATVHEELFLLETWFRHRTAFIKESIILGALLGELTIGEMDKTLCVVNFLSYIDNKRRPVFGINIRYN